MSGKNMIFEASCSVWHDNVESTSVCHLFMVWLPKDDSPDQQCHRAPKIEKQKNGQTKHFCEHLHLNTSKKIFTLKLIVLLLRRNENVQPLYNIHESNKQNQIQKHVKIKKFIQYLILFIFKHQQKILW